MVEVRRKDQTCKTFGQDWEIEKEARERMGLRKDLDIYMTSEGRRVDWTDLEEIGDGGDE